MNTGRIDEIVSNGLYDKATYAVSGNEAATFIQVHPTFLYESMWNLVLLLLIIFFFTKRKKFDGELSPFIVLVMESEDF